MADDSSHPDVLVKDSKGNIYYAPGSALKKLELPSDHPLHQFFEGGRPSDYKVSALLGRVEQHGFMLHDGQRALVPGGADGLRFPG